MPGAPRLRLSAVTVPQLEFLGKDDLSSDPSTYALAVGHLGDQIAGYGDFRRELPRPYKKLSFDEKIELQSLLARLGLYDSDIDGKIGSGTRSAIRKAQIKLGLNPDGFESHKLLKKLRNRG